MLSPGPGSEAPPCGSWLGGRCCQLCMVSPHGENCTTPGSSRRPLPGQPRSPQPPWADRTLEHIPGWGAGPAHLHHWARPQCFLSDELASSINPAAPRCASVSAARGSTWPSFPCPWAAPSRLSTSGSHSHGSVQSLLRRLAQGLLPPWTCSSLSKPPLESPGEQPRGVLACSLHLGQCWPSGEHRGGPSLPPPRLALRRGTEGVWQGSRGCSGTSLLAGQGGGGQVQLLLLDVSGGLGTACGELVWTDRRHEAGPPDLCEPRGSNSCVILPSE